MVEGLSEVPPEAREWRAPESQKEKTGFMSWVGNRMKAIFPVTGVALTLLSPGSKAEGAPNPAQEYLRYKEGIKMITEVQIGKTFIPEALKKVTIEGKTDEQFEANLTPMANLCELFKNSPTLWSEIQKNPEYIEEAQNEFRAFSHQVETQVRDKSLLKKN
jgi:hypothetical protein